MPCTLSTGTPAPCPTNSPWPRGGRGRSWGAVRPHRTGIGALIVHVHILDHDAALGRRVHQDDHTRVYGPLVIPGIEDGAVQPGHPVTRSSMVHL